jgi:UPF0042 nucleotide-binding protein
MSVQPPPRLVVLVTGVSGAGRSTVLRTLEDLGFEAVDNAPISLLPSLVPESLVPEGLVPEGLVPEGLVPERQGAEPTTGAAAPPEAAAQEPGAKLAVGIDTRTRGFTPQGLLRALEVLRTRGDLKTELLFLDAEDTVLLRRYTETRRRHPYAGSAGVAEGIGRERALLAGLPEAADAVIDTSAMPSAELRAHIERRYQQDAAQGLAIQVVSFAFPKGLPREADMVLDTRFLRNPFYVPDLKALTGLDQRVASYVAADPDYAQFIDRAVALIDPLLPRMVKEGKKYLTIAVGCTGGQHRSVTAAERIAQHLMDQGWNVGTRHREIGQAPGGMAAAPVPATGGRTA